MIINKFINNYYITTNYLYFQYKLEFYLVNLMKKSMQMSACPFMKIIYDK